MRMVDKTLHVLMWLGLVISLVILAAAVVESIRERNFTDPLTWRLLGGLSVLWVPPALSLWQWDGAKPGPQSRWFYLFAILALLLAAAIAAYGSFLLYVLILNDWSD